MKLAGVHVELDASQRARLALVAFVGSLVCLVPLCLTWRLETKCSRSYLETDESVYYLPSEEWLVPLSIGYREAAAGVVWVGLLVYFGEQHEVRGSFEHLEPYLVGVTTLDPYFHRAYTWGSVAALYNGTLIHRSDVEMSIEMLERGLRYFPEDGDLHYYLGFQYYFELTSFLEGDEEERARRVGIDEICTAALLGGGPPYLPLMCSSMAQRRGFDQLAQERLLQSHVETEDPRTRTRIEERLEEYLTPDVAFRIMQSTNAVRLSWRRELPYMPLGLYLLVGPRPPVPVEDQVDLPLPMDAMIRAEEEDLVYSAIPAAEEPVSAAIDEEADVVSRETGQE